MGRDDPGQSCFSRSGCPPAGVSMHLTVVGAHSPSGQTTKIHTLALSSQTENIQTERKKILKKRKILKSLENVIKNT